MTGNARRALALVWSPLSPPEAVAGAHIRHTLKPGRRALYWHLLQWAGAQLSALIGVVVTVTAFDYTVWLPNGVGQWVDIFSSWADATRWVPEEWRWVVPLVAIGGFIVQFPISLLSVWLNWRATWYVVTDQGVQLHHGMWTAHEDSMRFANIQQVMLNQGPVQRLLGLADVVLGTAGQRTTGENDDDDDKRKQRGRFRDLEHDQAQQLLTQVRAHLPGAEPALPAGPAPAPPPLPAALDAARHALAEARALRAGLEGARRG